MNDYRIVMSPRAGADLKRIYDHITRNSPAHAAAVVQRILDALDHLKELPHRTRYNDRATGSDTPFDHFLFRLMWFSFVRSTTTKSFAY